MEESTEWGVNAIKKNSTWKLTSLPEWHKIIEVKWIFKTKRNAKEKVKKYKVRLIAKGDK
jgi:hypothetical protein